MDMFIDTISNSDCNLLICSGVNATDPTGTATVGFTSGCVTPVKCCGETGNATGGDELTASGTLCQPKKNFILRNEYFQFSISEKIKKKKKLNLTLCGV